MINTNIILANQKSHAHKRTHTDYTNRKQNLI